MEHIIYFEFNNKKKKNIYIYIYIINFNLVNIFKLHDYNIVLYKWRRYY